MRITQQKSSVYNPPITATLVTTHVAKTPKPTTTTLITTSVVTISKCNKSSSRKKHQLHQALGPFPKAQKNQTQAPVCQLLDAITDDSDSDSSSEAKLELE